MKFSIVTVLAAIAASVSAAYTPPDYSKDPTGNPIYSPGLEEQVPAGKPYTITWGASTPGKVSLVLLRGPSNNVQPIATIAEAIDNTGSYVWTPSTELEGDVIGYGILIVVEGTGQYQYSTQFGIKNDGYSQPPKTTDKPTDKPTGKPTSSGYPVSTPKPSSSGYPVSSTPSSYPVKTLTTSSSKAPTSIGYPTGTAPTAAPTQPPTYSPPAPSPSSPPDFNAAGRTTVGLAAGALAAVAAVFAL